jgi:small conductance mechanosensitive channel
MENFDQLYTWLITNGTRFLGAILFLIIGFWLVKIIVNQTSKVLLKRNIDAGLVTFMKSFFGIALKILIVISVMGMVGIQMTSFIAILGAAGLAVGLAFQGTLSNFAGGVMLLIFKPFKVGDFIEAQGYSGTVSEIQIFNSILKTVDNKTIIIPNGAIANGSMVNYTAQLTRRVDWKFGVAYGTDYKHVKQIITDIIINDPRVLKDPALFIGLAEMADSSINIVARAWTKTEDYWDVMLDVNEKIYYTFNKEGIEIPFPQMDVHIKNK